jgi:integrase
MIPAAQQNNKKPVDTRRWPGVLYYESASKRFQGRVDICYYIRYTLHDGSKRLEKVGWKSEKYSPQLAAEIRADRIRTARHGEHIKTARQIAADKNRHDRTLDDIAKAYFEFKGNKLKGQKTDQNRFDLHLKPVLGKRPISSLSPLDIDRVKAALTDHAPATVANTLELLRRLINYGTDKGLCAALSFTIKLPQKDNEVTEYLSPEETKRFLKVLNAWESPDVSRMLKLAMLTGLRRGEIFSLENQDIDFLQHLITIRDPKGGKTVTIPMSPPVKELFKKQQQWRDKKRPECPYLFPGRKGQKRVDCTAADRIKEKAKLPKQFRIFHGLRHHFAVTLANSGEFSLDMIGELLTHKSIAMTKRYSQFLPDTLKKASNRAAKLLMRQPQSSAHKKVLKLRK